MKKTAIYQFEHSPFCIPIVAVFKALGEPLQVVNISNADRSEILKLTKGAYYQVPVLVHGKNVVYESTPNSQDVARYTDINFAAGMLFPNALEGIQAIVISYLENEVEDVTFRLADPDYLDSIRDVAERGMVIRHKERKFGRGCVEQWRRQAAELRAKAAELLSPFDRMLKNSEFLFGEDPAYSDFLLLGIIGNLTYRGYNTLPARLKALAAWEKRMRGFRFRG